ncbi:hypothetical protein QR680_005042 [Steinernema hermaphroditum]|uniref:Transketolase-like pyrimidine-binding domain-containing protein n=1 Tax=Steinernema hermaphroditum TaxID=289476 RepID=A0AA39LUN5_9BILA|nr:hypothetical protein QR680_005042 [Steinernema hermaphroditum]
MLRRLRSGTVRALGRRLYHSHNGVFGFVESRASAFEPNLSGMTPEESQRAHLINAFRRYGYMNAQLDPLNLTKAPIVAELNPAVYGLDVQATTAIGSREATIADLVEQLRRVYCGTMAGEFMHLSSWEERQWFSQAFEQVKREELARDEQRKIAELMIKSQNFDNFLALKFPSVKRYGAEGAEAMFAFFHELFSVSPQNEVKQLILGMAHRGRLNLLTTLMEFPAVQMFRKMRGKPEFSSDVDGSGDVLSHLTSSFDFKTPEGDVHVTMLPNPSHLEAVNPVTMGKARARACTLGLGDYGNHSEGSEVGDGVICVQIHGDGAFTGQGVVWETLALSQCPHFRVGGSIHLVTNNQIAFTAEPKIGRSTAHCTDMAKAIDAPVIHVNGDHPEDLVRATRLALAYRQRFRKDVFVNLICFRRWGHNELDDPRFTQPLMYQEIDAHESVPDRYTKKLIEEGVFSEEERKKIVDEHTESLMKDFRAVESSGPRAVHLEGNWKGFQQAPKAFVKWETGVDTEFLRYIGAASVQTPETFNVHPHLAKTHCDARVAKMEKGEGIDWATAEALAFGSILLQGNDVRISGQDVGRGTFSHRHAMLVDQKTDAGYVPLNNLEKDQKNFLEVCNNLLSEEAILGFEFGYSMENPKRLCLWEAQFGDFFNGAQIMIDTFLASAESKWLTQSGLVMVLPHGIDGAGPEHSSCRMERFLQLSDSREDQKPADGENINFQVAHPTTSAQYFHLLRKQVITPYRKPLVIVGPKVLLRHPKAASTLADMGPGTHFQPVLADHSIPADKVTKVVFVSGKHCFTLQKERDERKVNNIAVVRLEGIAPFPIEDIKKAIDMYPKANKYVWSQEEARNAGCWPFVSKRFANALGVNLEYAGRKELAWTATAIGEHHQKEIQEVIEETFALCQ